MARNVTEQEIDALLVREEGPRPTVATRDFKEPRQLAPADLEALRRPADAAGAACVIAFRSFLPVPVELQNVEVAEASLDSALHKSGDAVVTLLAETAQGQALLVLDQAGAALLAEIALGADELATVGARPLSPLECTLLERVLARVLDRAAHPFQLTVKDGRLIPDRAALLRELKAGGDRRRVVVRLLLAIGPSNLVVQAFLPGVKAPAAKPPAPAPAKDERRTTLLNELAPTRVEVSAVLAEAEILLSELLALEIGDVIPLKISPGEPVEIRIEGQTRALARFGEHKGDIAVQITQVLKATSNR